MKNKIWIYSLMLCLMGIAMPLCHTTQISSSAMVGHSKEKVYEFYTYGESMTPIPDIDLIISGDSLFVISKDYYRFYEILYLFDNGICHYQQMNVYCSPCAEQIIDEMLKDRFYDFEAIDEINYRSQKNPRIIMRLRDQVQDTVSCSSISIHRIAEINGVDQCP